MELSHSQDDALLAGEIHLTISAIEEDAMTLTLTLSNDLEQNLSQEARRLGLTPDRYAVRILERNIPANDQRQKLMALLDARIAEAECGSDQDGDPDEFLRAIDEDRLSDRPLYPPEMKGVTW